MTEKPLRRRSVGPIVVSASDLRHGHVVWLTAERTWSRSFQDAALFNETDARAAFDHVQSDDRQLQVVDVHLVPVDLSAGPSPVTFRERIRVGGPTVAFGPGEREAFAYDE
jgi:hypothetical protein